MPNITGTFNLIKVRKVLICVDANTIVSSLKKIATQLNMS